MVNISIFLQNSNMNVLNEISVTIPVIKLLSYFLLIIRIRKKPSRNMWQVLAASAVSYASSLRHALAKHFAGF